MRKIRKLVVHVSDSPDTLDIGVNDIRHWHADPKPKGNGWSDIGYNFVIRRNGTVELGRPLQLIPAHTKGHNADSIGICWVGRDKPSYEQYHNLCITLKSLMLQYDLKPTDVYGHRELNPGKTCPNMDMDKLRKDIS